MKLPIVHRHSRERWLALAAAALGLFIVSALLHNLIYGLFDVEEAFFFILATMVAPLSFIGSLVAAAFAHPTPVGEGESQPWWSFGPPRGRVGKLALGLLVGCGVGFLLFFGGVAFGQRGGDTFFSNPYLALTILFAGACAVLAGVAAVFSVFLERERSFGAFMTIVFGMVVAFFAMGELAGHDEPGDGGDAGGRNSHTNLTVERVSGAVLSVSFDYSYNQDPTEARITMITVTALDGTGGPLSGYGVTRLPESGDLPRGDGHIALDLGFTEDQLQQVAAIRVCFAGEGHPDLGCATVQYTSR